MEELKIDCRVNGRLCGKCCYKAVVPLTRRDIERITSRGYRFEDFAEYRAGVPVLKNVDSHCVFLDPTTNACTIYEDRPTACRLYPLVYSPKLWVHVDPACPKAGEVPKEVVVRLASRVLDYYEEVKRDWLFDSQYEST